MILREFRCRGVIRGYARLFSGDRFVLDLGFLRGVLVVFLGWDIVLGLLEFLGVIVFVGREDVV